MTTTPSPETQTGGSVPSGSSLPLRLVPPEDSLGGAPMPGQRQLQSELAEDLDGNFERLVRHYQDRLYGFAHRLAGNREDAEEIAQDAFVRAYRALKTYPADRVRALALRAWLYQIALNVFRNRIRRKRHRLISISTGSGAPFDAEDDPAERPDSRFEARQRRADLATLVSALPERYRAPLVLRYVEGLSLEEVAAILKQPIGTTKSNVHRAINALRAAISASRRREVRP